jgi:signal transduction histidine kinase
MGSLTTAWLWYKICSGMVEATCRERSRKASGIGAVLFLYVLLRSPRNLFSTLVAGLAVCVFIWNLFEGYRMLADPPPPQWPLSFMFVGISFLPALLMHFALAFVRPRLRVRVLIRLVYTLATGLSVISLASLSSIRIMEFMDRYSKDSFCGLFLVLMGPVMVGTLVLFVVRFFTEPKAMRSIYGWVLLGALVGVPAGITDLMEGAGMTGIRVANLGAILACCILAAGMLKNREFFDSLARFRQATQRLLSETKHGLVTLNAGGKVVAINEAGTRLLGERPGTLSDIDESLPELLRAGGERFVPKQGRVLKATMWPETVTGRSPPFYLLLEDSTGEYELLHELAQRQSLALLGEAAATLAHEIRNPLAAISAAGEALATEGTSDPEMLEVLRGEARRLNKLVTQSLDLARPLQLAPEEVDLNNLLGRILAQPSSTAEVEFVPAEGLREIRLDPMCLKLVIDNLVRNAAQAGAEKITLRTAGDGDQAVITVDNDGPHIPPEIKGRLFQPFVTTKADGTGLGLALCSKIAKAHGGTIKVVNTDTGVQFEMRLPWTC